MEQSSVVTKLRPGIIAAFCVLAVLGCRGVASSGSGEDQGKLGIWLTDPGISEIDRLELTIVGVYIQPQDEAEPIEIVLDRPLVVDLTRVAGRTDGREKIIDNQALPVGRYKWIELRLDETRLFIEDQGSQYPLTIPPGAEDGLRLSFNSAVDDRTTLDLTIDFNTAKALRERGGQDFEFHPDLRMVRTERTGTLTGQIPEHLVRDNSCDNGSNYDDGNRVYLFDGTVNFQDLQGNEGDPIVVAPVTRETSGNDYEFSIGFLPHGSYTAVFTCDGSKDDPDDDNRHDMISSERVEVTISAGQTTSIAFESSF